MFERRPCVFLPLTAAALLCAAACSSDDDAAASSGETPASERLYVGATRVFGEGESVGYMFAVPSLAQGTEVSLDQAVELSDAWVFGSADPYLYTAAIFDPEITRWEVSKTGKFTKGPVINFSGEGIGGAFTAAFTPVFSAEKSYFIDPVSGQIVVWNPKAMELIRTITIDADPIGDFTPNMDLTIRGDQLVVSIFWTSELSGWTEYGEFVRTAIVDTKTDEVIATHDDTRCASISSAGETSDGTLYFSPWDYHTVTRKVFGDEFGAASCALRMTRGEDTLDTDYELDLSSLVGGRPTGSMKLLDDDTALLHVWHDDLVEASKENWEDTRFEPGYLWYRWRIGEDSAEPLPDQEPNSEGGEWRELDGRTVTYAANAEYSETTLHELESDGTQRELLTVPGWITQIIRAY